MTKKIQKCDVKKAIEGSGGYMSNIANKLNVSWHTAKKYVELFKLQEMIVEEDEKLNDLTEMKLIENIRNLDTASIIFRLKTRARNRGYVERVDVGITVEERANNLNALFPTEEELKLLNEENNK
jgi:hypothetical protein